MQESDQLLAGVAGSVPPDDAALLALVEEVARALTRAGNSLATAESCTGGWISKCCTDLSGSSAWFNGGVVSYSNPAKVGILGVAEEALLREGAVSARVAEQMAEGARRVLGSTWSVAVTGVAGPEGGTSEKPVGCVWFAWSGPGRLASRRQDFTGDREAVRRQAVAMALRGILAELGR